jgi:polysaccharide biosynthesis transport protein
MAMLRRWVGRRSVIGLFILSQTFSIYAWPGTTSLLTARADRINRESQFRQATSQEAASTSAVLQSPLIAKLKEEQAMLEGEYRKLNLTFRADYPKVQRLIENIGEVRRQIQTEVKRVVDAIKADYQAAVRNESQLEKALLQQQGQVRQLDEQMGQSNLL